MTETQHLKTGTTTVGIICRDGVVLAAEKKATMGYTIDSKVSRKVYQLDNHIGMTIAGSVGDAMAIIRLMKAQLKLYKLERGPITVKAAAALLENILQGNKYFPYMNMFILGGMDASGPQIWSLDPVGGGSNLDKYYSTGSGSPFAYGALEAEYNENITVAEGAALAIRAIKVAIERDIGSGGRGFTVALITKDGYKELTEAEIKAYSK
ncbi:MAG: archaeal proteasome endopeptidase complex subunit beta [Candidatus Aenigmatarchaeota archaeon]